MRVGRAAIGAALALTAVAGSASSPRAAQPPVTAQTVAVSIVQPGASPVAAGALVAPPTARGTLPAFSYPADGSALTLGGGTAGAAGDLRHDAAAAAIDLSSVSLFGGEITADAVSVRASASAAAGSATGNASGTTISNLVVLGQSVQASAGQIVALGDWGQAVLLSSQGIAGTTLGVASFREAVTALTVTLSADHGGLPAGTRIVIGSAAAFARLPLSARRAASPPSGQSTAPSSTAPPPLQTGRGRSTPKPVSASKTPSNVTPWALLRSVGVIPHLTVKRYVFPVYGPVGYGDSFGAARADTGWHHGDDIFAPLGAPILAVTDGTLYSVGWQHIGGNRLWLRDGSGNEFYYAHLSAYSPLAVDGADVKAGDVIGFVGNTGDAEGTPYHLHFEIHPASLLFLGYDGVVDPTPYLDAWRRLQDIRFPSGAAWASAIAPISSTPVPGAILLEARDISSASGLDPASLQRAVSLVPAEQGGQPDGADAARPAASAYLHSP